MHLSPSEYHHHLMQQIQPSLAYRSGDVLQWQSRLREKLSQLLGGFPEERPPLNVHSLWQQEHPLGRIEKIIFTSEPYADVPAYLCLPRSDNRRGMEVSSLCPSSSPFPTPPYPFMICLQGHTTGMHVSLAIDQADETLPIEVEGDRDFALGCLRNGVAALCLEQRSFGERHEQLQEQISEHGCHDAAMQALLLGKTLLGERIFDIDRGIDFLLSRGDADPRRIGVMGNSGGGTVSIYAAALLPRLSFAMPSSSFCTFQASLLSIYHCADNYVPGLYQYAEMADILSLFAPRPVVIVAGQDDDIFPIQGVLQAFEHLQEIYTALGAADQCQLVIGPGGHRFYADLAWPLMRQVIDHL
jgi:dienelactone hydrolase